MPSAKQTKIVLKTSWWFSTHLKTIRQIGSLPQTFGMKIKQIFELPPRRSFSFWWHVPFYLDLDSWTSPFEGSILFEQLYRYCYTYIYIYTNICTSIDLYIYIYLYIYVIYKCCKSSFDINIGSTLLAHSLSRLNLWHWIFWHPRASETCTTSAEIRVI